ncbi:Flp1 family type IVb pilin [Candidatus Weimeria sp. HCP3S3_B5]|uniref:Flp1 family type IVb pilin n=1 Tax=Candidatus Weimeria sp. HCP3S3_B5 TaxID=3438871 RepID=UPI002A92D76C|nr:Flp1 family type IVb pilin [Lachnospiraceae bacterium]MDY6352939.1 Flp1 family type IVb pilin [Lachnospiraceae bacterium]
MGFKSFIEEEDGIGTVEVVLLLVIIVVLVVMFRNKIKEVVSNALNKINERGSDVISTEPDK